ncbi:MAG: helix-turn-helix domain-containing protein [Clostridia bacterium]|nr:helix-turn-helix domain-containing protein [Clostridia bacterium]
MDKKELGNRIKSARSIFSKKEGIKLTQQLLAQKIGISRSYMGDIESGRTYPTFPVVKAIAEACNIPLGFLVDEIPDSDSISSLKPCVSEYPSATQGIHAEYISIPVLGIIRAGEPIAASQNIIGYEYIPYEMARGGDFFGLKVTGDSMNNSRIFDGDTVLVRRQEEVENGEIAVVMVDGESATIKRFFKTNSIITLVPDSSNKEYQPRFLDITKTEVKVLGKVVKVIINL